MGSGVNRHIVVAITGATGAGFAPALVRRLCANEGVRQVSLLASPVGRRCLADECDIKLPDLAAESDKIALVSDRDLGAAISSGSCHHDGMVIVPCTVGTMGRIVAGTSDNLIARAADVTLKERRRLVLCVRETPMNRIHLENALRAHDAGAVIMPLMPSFYAMPTAIADLFDTFATRIMDQLGLVEDDPRRWKG